MDTESTQEASLVRRAASATASAVRSLLQVLMVLPVMAGRLGVVLGKLLSSSSTMLARGSDKARLAVADAQVRAAKAAREVQQTAKEVQSTARELEIVAPRVTTASDRRRTRLRKFGIAALGAAVAAGIGAAVAAVVRSRRDQEMAEDLDPWSPADPAEGDSDGLDGDRVIDVSAAER